MSRMSRSNKVLTRLPKKGTLGNHSGLARQPTLKDIVSAKFYQEKIDETTPFLLGSLLRPLAFTDNGFVIGPRGIERTPSTYAQTLGT